MRGDHEVAIGLIYPTLLGTYGDNGNALVLQRRLQWRGIAARIHPIGVDDPVPEHCDVYVLGGGEDRAGRTAAALLAGDRGLRRAVLAGRPVLAVCAGLQILGQHVSTRTGTPYRGVGLLDLTTAAGTHRAVGEVLAQPRPGWGPRPLSGFENHLGTSTLGATAHQLATVTTGVGNGTTDAAEGAVQGSIVATYLHGPVLARNPDLADRLLTAATGTTLAPLEVASVTRLRTERLHHTRGDRPAVGT